MASPINQQNPQTHKLRQSKPSVSPQWFSCMRFTFKFLLNPTEEICSKMLQNQALVLQDRSNIICYFDS